MFSFIWTIHPLRAVLTLRCAAGMYFCMLRLGSSEGGCCWHCRCRCYCWKPRQRLRVLSWPPLLFTESSELAHSARQTPRHRRASCKVLHPLCSLTSIRDQLKALGLPSPLPFPKLHRQGGWMLSTVSRAVENRSRNQERLSGITVLLPD